MRRVMVVYGTRPEAVKMAPVIRALDDAPDLTPSVVVTGQHRSMLDQVNELFDIQVDHDLDIIEPRQTLEGITSRALLGLGPLIRAERPDAVLVQGDTTTTFTAALAAFYERVPVLHLEAGLRTGDISSPFPEEMNRRLTSQLAALHLAPTATSRANLEREGVDPAHIVVTGNTVIDALLDVVGRDRPYEDPRLATLDEDDRRVLLVTTHRRESWGEPMRGVGRAVATVARRHPDLLVVLPVHRNPVVREALLPEVSGLPNVLVVEPVAYGDFARLMARATLILTDSGGVQEEAPSLGKPVLVLRDNTERPEAVEAGTVRLVGTDPALVVRATEHLLTDPAAHAAMAQAVNPYGDGSAAERCVQAIRHLFGSAEAAEEFEPERLAAGAA
ncbi:non-hydrolyzing UDP-N-acetylglucosamine 2-epimerase [Geodermatophilus sp. SYSU D01105]